MGFQGGLRRILGIYRGGGSKGDGGCIEKSIEKLIGGRGGWEAEF